MEYTFKTSEEMDEMLAYNAEKVKSTPEELFAQEVTAAMNGKLRDYQGIVKDQLYSAHLQAKAEAKAALNK